MVAEWTPEFFARESNARLFAHDLGLVPESTMAFDSALAGWLAEYGKRVSARQRDELPGLNETPADRSIGSTVAGMASTEIGRLYVWARLSKAQDGLWAFAFGWSVTGPLLSRHRDAARPSHAVPTQISALVSYFQDVRDSPNSGLVDDVWSLADVSGIFDATGDARPALLAWLLGLLRRRKFHHSMRDLLRVLRATKPEDVHVALMLEEFEPGNDQAAMKVAGAAIRSCEGLPAWPAEAADVIEWLVDAKPKSPTQRWHSRHAIAKRVGPERLNQLARLIRVHPEWARHEPTGWRDELFWFMWKSASWHLGERVEPLLR